MLSQLSKTIKMALKSTEEERALLRARSAVQRFPVIEWRQRTEDFHKRSIHTSRDLAGSNAWRPSDGGEHNASAIGEHEDWNPEHQPYPTQPDWDRASMMSGGSPRMSATPMTPGSPFSDNPQTPGDHLTAPPRLGDQGRRGSFSTDVSDTDGDYFSNNHSRQSTDSRQDYSGFLDRANRVIAKEQRHAPDPFLDAQPARPFGAHSRVSSVESISSIVDEKSNSPLNKAVASVCVIVYSIRRIVLTIGFSSPIRTVVSPTSSRRSCRPSRRTTRSRTSVSKSS
jgi:alpha-1,3-glucan synthase